MGRTRVLLTALLTTALVGAAPFAPLTPAASAAESPVPVVLETTSTTAATTKVPVPPGVTPSAITGVLNMDETPAGRIEFLVNDRVRESVPTTLYAKVRLPVTPADVRSDRTIGLALRYVAPASSCVDPAGLEVEALLRKVTLVHTGTEPRPDTIGTFFPDVSPRVDVVVPPDADEDLLAAGLAAVASVTSRYPEETNVALIPTAGPVRSAGIGHRVITIEPGGEVINAALVEDADVPTLALSGDREALLGAAYALGTPAIEQVASDRTDELAAAPGRRDVGLTRSLSDLGVDTLVLDGWGRSSYVVDVPADAFGGPIDDLDLTIAGTPTDIPPGAQAQLDVRLNGTLIRSVNLADETPAATGAAPGLTPTDPLADFGLAFTTPVRPGALAGQNELVLTLTALPEGGCLPDRPQLPLELDLDTEVSGFGATRGDDNLAGFPAYPQALEGELDVALRAEGGSLVDSAVRASLIVAALQRAAAAPLEVTLVDAAEFVGSDRSGLLVGATYTDSVALGVPMRLESVRLLDNVDAEVRLGSSQPFAALQSVQPGSDRHVLALGSWSGSNGTAPELSTRVAREVATVGWADLEGDILLADVTNRVTAMTSNLAPQVSTRGSDTTDDTRNWLFWVFVAGAGVLLLLVLLQLLFAARRSVRLRLAERRVRREAEPERPTGLVSAAARAKRPDDGVSRPEGSNPPPSRPG